MMIRVTRLVIDQLESGKIEWNEHPLILVHPGSSPKHKSLQDLSIRIKTKVAEEAIDGVGLGVDGGAQFRLNSHMLL
jgi:hypothetical protein